MINISYSTLNLIHTCPHNFLNKQMGIPQEDKEFFKEGREAHRIIQDHVSGKKRDDRLSHIDIVFPVVEEKDFDERCKFSYAIPLWEDEYNLIGYIDGMDTATQSMLEIKTSSGKWSIGKFKELMQRKVYALARPDLEYAYLITGQRDPEKWRTEKPKLYKLQNTEQDRKEALEWIFQGIIKIEAGEYTSDLVDGKCIDPRCYWGKNCYFFK